MERRLLVLMAALFGLLLRIWILASPLGGADADEAIVGLMALDLLQRGEPTTFYWGQAYGGSHEAFLAAAVFAVTETSPLALKMVPIALNALAALLVWRVGLRLGRPRAAVIGAVIFWVASGPFVWWSTKARGHYSVLLVLELLLVLLALRLDDRRLEDQLTDRRAGAEAAGLGLVGGLAWWASPQSALVGLPLLIWFIYRFRQSVASLWPAVPGAIVGALPWLRFNVEMGWSSLRPPAGLPSKPSLIGQFQDLALVALPQALGLRVPFSLEWIPPVAGPLVCLAAVALLGCGLYQARRRSGLLPVLILPYLPLLLINPIHYVADPRYLYFLWPFLALLAGFTIVRFVSIRLTLIVVVFALGALSSIVIDRMIDQRRAIFYAPDVAVPSDLSDLIEELDRRDMDHVFAHYALAYPITFESQRKVLATPILEVRDPEIDQAVRSAPNPTYVFLADSFDVQDFRDSLSSMGIDPVCDRFAEFLLCRPEPKVLPERVTHVWTD